MSSVWVRRVYPSHPHAEKSAEPRGSYTLTSVTFALPASFEGLEVAPVYATYSFDSIVRRFSVYCVEFDGLEEPGRNFQDGSFHQSKDVN